MVFENVKVAHKTFGAGVITNHVGNYITVAFSTATKKFVYPDAFDKFLTLEDGTVSDEIMRDLAASKQARQAIEDKKREENLRSMTHGIVIPGKEAGPENDDEERQKEEEI